jgi:hypothetical protein
LTKTSAYKHIYACPGVAASAVSQLISVLHRCPRAGLGASGSFVEEVLAVQTFNTLVDRRRAGCVWHCRFCEPRASCLKVLILFKPLTDILSQMSIIFLPDISFTAKQVFMGLLCFDGFGIINQSSMLGHAAHFGGSVFGVAFTHYLYAVSGFFVQ